MSIGGMQLMVFRESVLAIAEQLGLNPANYQNWDLLFDGIGHEIQLLKEEVGSPS